MGRLAPHPPHHSKENRAGVRTKTQGAQLRSPWARPCECRWCHRVPASLASKWQPAQPQEHMKTQRAVRNWGEEPEGREASKGEKDRASGPVPTGGSAPDPGCSGASLRRHGHRPALRFLQSEKWRVQPSRTHLRDHPRPRLWESTHPRCQGRGPLNLNHLQGAASLNAGQFLLHRRQLQPRSSLH